MFSENDRFSYTYYRVRKFNRIRSKNKLSELVSTVKVYRFKPIKMILQCVLMSIAFVNVSAVTQTEYKKELHITNTYFGLAQQKKGLMSSFVNNYLCSSESTNLQRSVFLDYVYTFVEGLIKSATASTVEVLVIALVAPDYPDLDLLQQSVNYERQMQNYMRLNHGIEVEFPITSGKNVDTYELSDLGKSRRNIVKLSIKRLFKKAMGLVCSLVDSCICSTETIDNNVDEVIVHLVKSNRSIAYIVIALAVPDYAEPEHLDISREVEAQMQQKIGADNVSVVNPDTTNIDFARYDIRQLGDTRRNIVKKSLKRIIKKIIEGHIQLTHLQRCYLKAVKMSMDFPKKRIILAAIGREGYCHLSNLDGTREYVFDL